MSTKHLLLSCVCAAAALSTSAFAQTEAPAADEGAELEELVVTAEKREQSLQDVPVAVSAFSDERREMVGINSVQDLTNFTPGLAYATNNDRIALRGIGRFTNNRSSEGGVAMYNDGFYTSSVTSFAQSTLFIERTEALRGPQGTLYGRNSIGGALNIISKRPTDDFEAEIRGSLGNYDLRVIEGAVSGPLFGAVRGRLAGSYSDQNKGYFTNLAGGPSEGGRGDQWYVEGQLEGELADGKLDWWLKASTQEWHNLGRGPGGRTTSTVGVRESGQLFNRTPGITPNPLFGFNEDLPGNICRLCFSTDDENAISLENNNYTLHATLHLDNFDIRYIGGFTYYDYRLQTDLDATARSAPFTITQAQAPTGVVLPGGSITVFPRQNNQYQEEVWWFSNELNFASTHEGPLQWLVGLYQYREGSNYTLSDARFPDDVRFEQAIGPDGRPAAPNALRRYAYGSSENVNESYAVFGQIDYKFTDTLKATACLRYTYDQKRSFESARLFCFISNSPGCPAPLRNAGRPVDVTNFVSAGPTTPQVDPSVVGPVYTDPTTGLRHRMLKNDWSGVTGTLGLDWQPDPDTLVYAKYTRGYKAGGFNSGTTTLQQRVTTDEETIDAYEIGVKKTFARRLQANASLFYYDYQDIQVPLSGLNPVTQTNQTEFFNLPKARIMGFELETVWQPIDNLQILANYSYLDAGIREACCFQDPEDPRGLQPGVRLAGNTAAALANPFAALNQDLRGATLPSSTPHRVTVNVNYTWEFDPGNLSASATYVWRDDTYYSVFNRYYNRAKAFEQVDARLLWQDRDDRYTVIAYVKNLFDVRGSTGVSGSRVNAVGPNEGFVNQTISYIPPRLYGVELQYRF
jgi:iron complex outermembrane recepter protein